MKTIKVKQRVKVKRLQTGFFKTIFKASALFINTEHFFLHLAFAVLFCSGDKWSWASENSMPL